MMEEQEYIQRFNQGYLLAMHEPKLFEQITKGNKDNDAIKAMKEGAKEFEKEKVRERLQEIKEMNSKNKDKQKDKS